MEKAYLQTPLWDVKRSEQERLEYLLGELTLEEKLQCLGTGCPDIPRLGIRAFKVGGEGAHGVQARHDQTFDIGEPDLTTIFPNPIGMSATWDVDLIRQAGHVTGAEARGLFAKEQKGCLCLWAPTIDLERDPRWGRTEEAYGEDPYLTGEMAGAYVDGIQGEDAKHLLAGATVKHFYANNVEEGRVWKSSSIDPRNREEYYLEPFRRVIVEHGAVGMMTAYNEVNGIPCILNPEVQKIAKEQWGLLHAVCDGGDMSQTVEYHRYFENHADTIAAGLRAGIDCFTDDDRLVQDAANAAYARGRITDRYLDRALWNHFRVMLRLGLFDPEESSSYAAMGPECVGSPAHCQIAEQVTEEAVVLLQNEADHTGKRLLPIERGQKIAAIGPLMDAWYKDWYSGLPPYCVTPLQGLRDLWEETELLQEDGICLVRIRLGDGRYLGISEKDGTVLAVSKEEAETFRMEQWDREKMTLQAGSNGKFLTTEDAFDKGQNGLVTASSREAFGWFVREVFLYQNKGKDSYEVHAWNGARLQWNEEGRLCVGRPAEVVGSPVVGVAGYIPEERTEEESLNVFLEIVKDGICEAVEIARQADVSVLFLGPNPMINCKEEIDRTTLEFPPYQQKLMEAVYAANPRTVLVLISSIPFGIVWAKKHLPAIVTTASGSMELGHGLAKILTGERSPAGRLPMTWYQSEEELPPMDDYDIIRGERTYQYFKGESLYPFGHGLTYSEIQYDHLTVRKEADYLLVCLDIRNAGSRATDEVVQIYGRKRNSVVKRPGKQLLAFRRVHALAPDGSSRQEFRIPVSDLYYYEVIRQEKILEPGEYEIMAGASSGDIRLCCSVMLEGTDRGFRDACQFIPADHYDCSENADLREGRDGYALVCTRENTARMQLEYQRVQMAGLEKNSILELELSGDSQEEIQIRLNGKMWNYNNRTVRELTPKKSSAKRSLRKELSEKKLLQISAQEMKTEDVVTIQLECGAGVKLFGFRWLCQK